MDVNFDELLSKLNFSDPVNGEDLLKWILGEVDPIIFSNNIRDNMINPLLEQIKGLYDKIGKTAKETTDNKSAVERLSEPLGLTLVYKESSKHRKKVRDSISPIVDKLAVLYDSVGKGIDSNTKDRAHAMADPLGILDIHKEYKRKVKGVVSKAFDGLKSKNIEESFDKVSADESSKKGSFNLIENSKTPVLVRLDVNTINDLIASTFNVKIKNDSLEQKSLDGEKTNGIDTNSITPSVINALKYIGLENLSDKFKKNNESIIDALKNLELSKTKSMGWLSALMAGGLLVGTIGLFWTSHIKPWLEKKFDFKLDFMDKFGAAIEGIGKWFTLGGLKSGQLLLNIGGEMFKSFEGVITGFFSSASKIFFGGTGEKGLIAGAGKIAGFLPKLAGKILGGFSKAMLKGIPVIGALFSFGFAVEDFRSGDNIGGMVNIVSGLANLLNLVPGLQGVGSVLSIGIDVMGAILDVKAGDGTVEEKQARKADILKNWGKQLLGILKKVPFIETMVNMGEGFYKIFTGDYRAGFEQLNGTPIGTLIGPFMAIFDNIETDSSSIIGVKFNFQGFIKDFKRRTLRGIMSWFPSAFGFRSKLADMMGIGEEFRSDQWESENQQVMAAQKVGLETSKSNPNYDKNREDILNTRLEEQTDRLNKYSNNKTGFNENDYQYLLHEVEATKKYLEIERSKRSPEPKDSERVNLREVKVNDLFMPSKSVYDPATNTNYSLSPDDNIIAYKSDGVFDKSLSNIEKVVMIMGKKLNDLSESISTQKQPFNSISVSNNTTSQPSNASIIMSGKRDPIFDVRADYWRKYPNERAFI